MDSGTKDAVTDTSTYTVHARRSGGWWSVAFDDDRRIHTQARRLDQIPDQAAAALTDWYADDDGRVVTAERIDVLAELDEPELATQLAEVTTLRADADQLATEARHATWLFVRATLAAGLSTRDIGELLDMSHQWVARIAKEDEPASDEASAELGRVVLSCHAGEIVGISLTGSSQRDPIDA